MKQIRLFLTALMFYTRIPVPKSVGYTPENMNQSTGYLPLVGILVGAAGGGVYLASSLLLPVSLSVILCMLTTILLTGAFHEDSIADFCDGFGGGRDRESILRIMKDSCIGTYGSIGIVMSLLLRYVMLSNVKPELFMALFIAGNAYSRFQPILMIQTSEYQRKDSPNKSGAVAGNHNPWMLVQGFILALIPMFFLPLWISGILIAVEFFTFFLFRKYVIQKIGGYTGDVLGALQQISELIFYLFFIIIYSLS
jgi:adenosylcobinamide-GDP ribazoletransferase